MRRSIFALIIAALLSWQTTALAASSSEQQLIDQARIAVDQLRGDPNMSDFAAFLIRAKAVIVVPELVKASFFIGGEGGSGVLLVRDSESREWSYPAFYTLASASIGLQFGAQVSKVMFLIMTDGGLKAMMTDKLTLGADISIAAGPVGAGVEASTTSNADADIYSFSHSKGLFGGVSFEGAVLVPNDDANEAYYSKAISARGIVIHREVENANADGLRAALVTE